MNTKINRDKLITISTLPIMWLVYFLFEIISRRVDTIYSLLTNLSLTILFALTGWIIYLTYDKHPNGFNSKALFLIFSIIMIFEQGIKIIIKLFFFDKNFEIIHNFISFEPIINTQGSWLNARFGLNVGFSILIFLNIIALILFVEFYRYYLSKNNKSFWADMSFLFITAGALCSLIDKIFYGGSLDFIGISDLFIADVKDIYINLGVLFFVMLIYKSDFLKDEDQTNIKDDLNSIKQFLIFMKNDILRK